MRKTDGEWLVGSLIFIVSLSCAALVVSVPLCMSPSWPKLGFLIQGMLVAIAVLSGYGSRRGAKCLGIIGKECGSRD